MNVLALIDMEPQRENLIKNCGNYDVLNNVDEEAIWEIYKHVVPFVGKSGVPRTDLEPEKKELLTEFRLRYLEEE